jgi:hypothetical protein
MTQHEVEEKVIQMTTENWSALFKNSTKETGLILTNKRLILKSSGESIYLHEINNIDIDTKITNNPCIKFTYGEELETHIRFFRTTSGTTFHVLLGDSGKVSAENALYTSYWASLLTMAKFLYGSPKYFENSSLLRARKD